MFHVMFASAISKWKYHVIEIYQFYNIKVLKYKRDMDDHKAHCKIEFVIRKTPSK